MAASDERKKPQARALPPDLDATRLGSSSGVNRDPASQTWEDYPTTMATPAAMSPTYSAPVYPEPVYPEPPQQPMVSPPPATYSPFPGYSSPAAQSVPPSTSSPESPQRNWGIIGVSVLLVVALIALAIGATWLFTSKGEAKKGETASQSQSESTQTNTVLETTVTSTQAPTQAAKSIPANAVYEGDGFETPTGNIGCSMSSGGVYCQIGERQWQLGCDGPWGVQLDASGVTEQCYYHGGSDPQHQATYGTIYYNGDFACEVGQYTGVNCWNSKTGHGFTMRREDYSTY